MDGSIPQTDRDIVQKVGQQAIASHLIQNKSAFSQQKHPCFVAWQRAAGSQGIIQVQITESSQAMKFTKIRLKHDRFPVFFVKN